MDWIDLAQGRAGDVFANYCKSSNEPTSSIKCGEFLN